MVKKNRSGFGIAHYDVRARSYSQITMLGQDEKETDAKKRTSTNLASQLTNPLTMVKKTFQSFKSLNFEARARS